MVMLLDYVFSIDKDLRDDKPSSYNGAIMHKDANLWKATIKKEMELNRFLKGKQ